MLDLLNKRKALLKIILIKKGQQTLLTAAKIHIRPIIPFPLIQSFAPSPRAQPSWRRARARL